MITLSSEVEAVALVPQGERPHGTGQKPVSLTKDYLEAVASTLGEKVLRLFGYEINMLQAASQRR